MTYHTTLAVVIGRVQGLHDGHSWVIAQAGRIADEVLFLVGSSYRPRSLKNPQTYEERAVALREDAGRLGVKLTTLPVIDTLYDDDLWVQNVKTAVKLFQRSRGIDPETCKVVLVGFEKDKSSRYLKWFTGWHFEASPAYCVDNKVLNATDLRDAIILDEKDASADLCRTFGETHVHRLLKWRANNPDAARLLRKEGLAIRAERKRISAAEAVMGFAIPINCADAVVIQSGHLLVTERGPGLGEGCFALPGGHIEPKETALQAAVRELTEETHLDIPKGVLLGEISKGGRLRNPADTMVFDHPERSERGWVRTQAFRWNLKDAAVLEKVRGGSDARRAFWMPIYEITPGNWFEDHFDIIQAMAPGVSLNYAQVLMAHLA